jgi:twitching motility protein PilU
MVEKEGSDLYFSAGAPVNLSIQGTTYPIGKHVLGGLEVRELVYSILNDEQKAQFEREFELNMALGFGELGRFRINVFRQRGEVAMVARYIKSNIPSLESLGLPPILKDLIMEKMGLILVVGATGSGKSTTLAAMIDYRNTHTTGHILTIEDPIEFVHEHKKSVVDQREVGLDTKSYGEALKNALREAPHVIVVGEIRDHDTMQHAIHYAETGHVCLSTLHANNANQTIERIVTFFPDSARQGLLMDLSQHLRAIISQRLVKGVDGKRVPAVEILLNSPFIAELIAEGRVGEIKEAMAQAAPDGMQTFDQSLYKLYEEGRISAEAALQNADSRNNLRLKMRLEHAPGAHGLPELTLDNELEAVSLDLRRHH